MSDERLIVFVTQCMVKNDISALTKRVLEIDEERGRNDRKIASLREENKILHARLKEEGCKVYASIWFRDCDMAEGSYAYEFDSFEEFKEWEKREYESAEGPMSISLITKEQFDNFQSSSRDLVLEAFEDGHPHVVYP